jgi:hypothetical protein
MVAAFSAIFIPPDHPSCQLIRSHFIGPCWKSILAKNGSWYHLATGVFGFMLSNWYYPPMLTTVGASDLWDDRSRSLCPRDGLLGGVSYISNFSLGHLWTDLRTPTQANNAARRRICPGESVGFGR